MQHLRTSNDIVNPPLDKSTIKIMLLDIIGTLEERCGETSSKEAAL